MRVAHALARTSLSPHAKQFISNLPPSSLTHGIPYGGIVSFRLRVDARSAEALLPKRRWRI
ncbi:uncharacterized protein F5147DRAFT_712825 [Suillus discolor]|uniref:Uncharacterized protein n=1 Tax=Suillus discolor TaxID=1912936 RepID=A0A9P7F092_9AGAM|nr:uncharacterized protein F5147DRAFT_712825 [Suillus discolor]KAG2098935.1 hypothetical protein F5147DRAFT_712825 [Suillus discolor]